MTRLEQCPECLDCHAGDKFRDFYGGSRSCAVRSGSKRAGSAPLGFLSAVRSGRAAMGEQQ